MPYEIERAFNGGIAIDASAVTGFGGNMTSDLFLKPDPSTISVLPWRPEHGRVVRMYCNIYYSDGRIFERDTRNMLIAAIKDAKDKGIDFTFGSEMEFYLFNRDENGEPTKIPYDYAGYMDIAPEDKGENVRREICLTLEQMGIRPESSHHEEGPGQNEIDFRYSDPLTAADNAITFRSVVNTVAARNGLYADFSPKPFENQPGNGMHINISAYSNGDRNILPTIIAGILNRISDITVFLNSVEDSYKRFGRNKAPKYISWSSENRSQLIRIPAATGEYKRAELRSPDSLCNPYLVFALLIRAGLEGIENKEEIPYPANMNLYEESEEVRNKYETLPLTLKDAKTKAKESDFVAKYLPQSIIDCYCK
jgi:glutamine synthetase